MPLARIFHPLPHLDRLNRSIARALDVFLPPRCILCGTRVQDHGALCLTCWNGIRFLVPPACAQCGQPFPYDPGPKVLCPSCIAEPPPFDRARAAFAYDDHSRRLVLALKHA
ncbi:MAG TPA: double zinc ribbon domain-containing protein, partial [Stellaceae bacterium]|nr:double zinc ribbon domain-containing protein [Stellaceae bacterium]